MLPQPQLAPANPVLTAFGVAYFQELDKGVATKIFPWRPVANMTGRYNVYSLEDALRDDIQKISGNAESPELEFGKHQELFGTERYGGRMADNDELLSEWSGGSELSVQQAITRYLLSKAAIRIERDWHANFFVPNVWGTTVVGTDDNDAATGKWSREGVDFIRVIQNACDTVESRTGFRPNKLVLGARVYTMIQNMRWYRELRPENQQWAASKSKLEMSLGLDQVLISRVVANTSLVGASQARAMANFIAGDSALLCYVEPNMTPLTPTAGCTFTTRNAMGRALGEGMGFGVYRYATQSQFALWTDVRANWQMKVTAPLMGVFFQGII